MSSLSGLNAAPSTATRLPMNEPPQHLAGEVDHAGAAAHVDGVDLAQEGQRLVGAELAGPGHERADVLGQAAAAEAEAGAEELARRSGRRARSRRRAADDVGAGRLAHLGHRVDERDLGGQERVRRGLDELGGGVVGDHDGRARRRAARRTPRPAARASALAGRPGDAVDQPVGVQRVLDRVALAQELGVPGERDLRRRARRRACRRAGRRCRPGRWTCRRRASPGAGAGQRASTGGVDVGRSAANSPVRCGVPTQTKCTSRRRPRVGEVGGEAQPAGGQRPR